MLDFLDSLYDAFQVIKAQNMVINADDIDSVDLNIERWHCKHYTALFNYSGCRYERINDGGKAPGPWRILSPRCPYNCDPYDNGAVPPGPLIVTPNYVSSKCDKCGTELYSYYGIEWCPECKVTVDPDAKSETVVVNDPIAIIPMEPPGTTHPGLEFLMEETVDEQRQ